jgi:hypothetical protein
MCWVRAGTTKARSVALSSSRTGSSRPFPYSLATARTGGRLLLLNQVWHVEVVKTLYRDTGKGNS